VAEKRIRIERHLHQLSPEEKDEVVGAVADLIVNYVKAKGLVPDEFKTGKEERDDRDRQ